MNQSQKSRPFRSPNVEDIEPVSATPQTERRRGDRHATGQNGAMTWVLGTAIVDIVDLSQNGAKLRLVNGNIPNIDHKVSLTLFDNTTVQGRVSWLDSKHIGVAFLTPMENVDERLTFDHLGGDFFVNALQLQNRVNKG